MDQYGGRGEGLISDMNNRPTHFHLIPPPLDIYSAAAADYRQDQYEVPMLTTSSSVIHHQLHFISNSAPSPVLTDLTVTDTLIGGEGTANTGRWPRQETLTLLEIRSSLDSMFKISNHKGPLWDQVSRIMATEYGYNRSGKKCREKFDNLNKYYKKTKDGKVGRQDGKHYRFFRQLESLYGETEHPPPLFETHYNPYQDQNLVAHSNSSDFDTLSSYDDDEYRWKAKIKRFIDLQMRKLMEKQEEWLEKVMKTMERKEQERMLKEEEWRKQEVARVEKEHEFWAKERAWIEARDASIMDSFHKLVQRRDTGVESRLVNVANMSHLGYNERSGQMWNSISSNSTSSTKDQYYSKKGKENPRNGFEFNPTSYEQNNLPRILDC